MSKPVSRHFFSFFAVAAAFAALSSAQADMHGNPLHVQFGTISEAECTQTAANIADRLASLERAHGLARGTLSVTASIENEAPPTYPGAPQDVENFCVVNFRAASHEISFSELHHDFNGSDKEGRCAADVNNLLQQDQVVATNSGDGGWIGHQYCRVSFVEVLGVR